MKFTYYKLLTLGVILLIFHVKLFSQHEFSPGYIITNTKDTIRGLIDDKSSISSLNICLFKRGLNEDPTKYTADEIQGYRFNNGRYFVTYKLVKPDFEKHVFFEYLIKAKIDVYRSIVSESGTEYYMKKDSLFILLENLEKSYKDSAGIDYKTYNNKYKGQLGYLMKDQPTLVPVINNMNFITSKGLVKLARKYHKLSCNGEDCIEYAKNDTSVRIKWGIGFSYGLPNLTLDKTIVPFYNYIILYNLSWNFNNNKQYGVNFPIEIIFKSFSRKLSLNISPGIFKTEFKSEYSAINGENTYSSIININITSIDFPFYLKYSFNSSTWKVWPFIGLGLKYSRFLNTKSNFKLNGYSTEYNSSDFEFSKYQDALFVTGGIDLPFKSNKVNIGVSWEEGDGIYEGKFLNNFRQASKTSMLTMSAAFEF